MAPSVTDPVLFPQVASTAVTTIADGPVPYWHNNHVCILNVQPFAILQRQDSYLPRGYCKPGLQ